MKHERACVQVLNVSLRTTKKLFTSKLNIKKTIREAKNASREVCLFLALNSETHPHIAQEQVQNACADFLHHHWMGAAPKSGAQMPHLFRSSPNTA